jgi:uncharacterized protein YqgV (UPF0045/DUF77 family)
MNNKNSINNYLKGMLKVYKRNINTEALYNLMERINNNKTLQKATKNVSKEEFLEKMNKLKEKAEVKIETKSYETIQENLNESLRVMKELNAIFEKIKEKSMKIDIKIEKEQELIQENKLDTLNKGLKNIRELTVDQNNILKGDNTLIKDAEEFKNSASFIRKSILDVEWLQPFLDFMHNHSTLVLTIGSGLVMGGMWYMNNVGYINIGSLLTRLGIQIFSPAAQNSPQMSAPSITLSSETPRVNSIGTVAGESNEASSIGRGFFRQLGEKVLKLIDALIVKLESKQQKYK